MDLLNSVLALRSESFSQSMNVAVVKSRLEADRALVEMISEVVQASKADGKGSVVDIMV